jgi:hypothetical protein
MRKRNHRRGVRALPFLDQLDDRCMLSSGLTPAQLTSAYGLNAVTFTLSSGATVKGDGSGETIALIEAYHDPSLPSDLKTFDQTYGLPNPKLTVIDQAGTQTNSGWETEESLDVEWAHAIAPGANILVVEAKSQSLQDLLNAVNTARNTAGVVVVSMSWGFPEVPNETSYDAYFTTPAGHEGVTFVAASGDSGVVEYPSASPNVLAVGGTTLTLTSSGSYGSETAWYDSGGGYSQYEPEPSYQLSVQTTGQRSTPDVAFDANPDTGVNVYGPSASTFGSGSSSSWQVVGGTSVGAPAWAAIIAIADQGRALAGKGSLNGPTQTLPTLYSLPASDFHTVSAAAPWGGGGFSPGGFDPFGGFGAFGFAFGFVGGFGSSSDPSAGSSGSANTSTGLGTPAGASLINGLADSTLTVPISTSSGSGSGGSSPSQPTKPVRKGSKRHHSSQHAHAVKRSSAHAKSGDRARQGGQDVPKSALKDHHVLKH